MKKLVEYAILFFIGGIVYYMIELVWRGHSYLSMIAAGGCAFILLGLINSKYEYDMSLIAQTVVGGLILTAVELIFGIILNIILNLNIWDYSNEPYNFLGQICLSYMYLWQWLSLVGIVLNDYSRYILFNEQKPKYKLM